MGTPIPPPLPVPPVPPGELCSACWGPGGAFGGGPTPSSITIEFDGISKGPNWAEDDGPPPEGSFDLPQHIIASPCEYLLRSGLEIIVSFFGPQTLVFGSKVGGFEFFAKIHDGACATVISSDLNDHFTGGTATITIPGVV